MKRLRGVGTLHIITTTTSSYIYSSRAHARERAWHTYNLQFAQVIVVTQDGQRVALEEGNATTDRLQAVVDAIDLRRAVRQVLLQRKLLAVDQQHQIDPAHLRAHARVSQWPTHYGSDIRMRIKYACNRCCCCCRWFYIS